MPSTLQLEIKSFSVPISCSKLSSFSGRTNGIICSYLPKRFSWNNVKDPVLRHPLCSIKHRSCRFLCEHLSGIWTLWAAPAISVLAWYNEQDVFDSQSHWLTPQSKAALRWSTWENKLLVHLDERNCSDNCCGKAAVMPWHKMKEQKIKIAVTPRWIDKFKME